MRGFLFVIGFVLVSLPVYGKRNIFAPPAVVVKKPKLKVIVASKNPLQRYRLEAYRLTGIVVSTTKKEAVIVAPDGKTYFVKEGDYLGNMGEKIVAIERNALVLVRGDKRIVFPIKAAK